MKKSMKAKEDKIKRRKEGQGRVMSQMKWNTISRRKGFWRILNAKKKNERQEIPHWI